MIAPELKGRTWTGNQSHRTLLVDGFVAGLWHWEEASLTVELFGKVSKAEKEHIVAEGERVIAEMSETAGPGHVRFGSIHG